MNARTLGIVNIAACLTAIIGVLLFQVRFGTPPTTAIGLATLLLWPLGNMAGLTGLILNNGVGSNPVVRAVAFLPVIGFGLTIVAVLAAATGIGPAFDVLTPISFIVLIIGMVLVGVLTIAARTWLGWRRFVPLFIIVMVVLGRATRVVDVDIVPGQVMVLGIWMLLGYAVATTDGQTALERPAAV